MPTRSRIKPRNFLKHVTSALTDDWRTSTNFASYQLAKETFSYRHPLGAKHGRGDKLRQISVRITDMCNLRCHSCGQWGDNGYLIGQSLKELKQREVPIETYKKLVDDLVEQNLSPLWYFWGGEPMLYPNIMELFHYIHDAGMPITIVSNGTNMAKYAEDLIETCQIIWLSIDGPNEEIHNTQRPGVSKKHDNFRDVKNALETLARVKQEKEKFYPLIVPISCITAYNTDYVTDIYRLTNEHADMHIFYLTWWIDPHSAQEHTKDFERRFGFKPKTHYGWVGAWHDFDHSLILDRFKEMEEISDKTGRCAPIMMPKLTNTEDIREYYTNHKASFGYDQCVSIFMAMEIDSNGDVSLCRDYHDYIIGNIKTDSVESMWNNQKALQFRSSIATEGTMPVCRRCCGLMGY